MVAKPWFTLNCSRQVTTGGSQLTQWFLSKWIGRITFWRFLKMLLFAGMCMVASESATNESQKWRWKFTRKSMRKANRSRSFSECKSTLKTTVSTYSGWLYTFLYWRAFSSSVPIVSLVQLNFHFSWSIWSTFVDEKRICMHAEFNRDTVKERHLF